MNVKELAVTIDTIIADLEQALVSESAIGEVIERSIRREAGQKETAITKAWDSPKKWDGTLDQAITYLTESEKATGTASKSLSGWRKNTEAITQILTEIAEAEEVYAEYRWQRAYLVTNSNGHVHKATWCGTCFPTTKFEWLVSYSGSSEKEIVDDAGELACTVCYPTAPAEVLNRPSAIVSKDRAQKEADKQAREAAKQQREEKRIAKSPTKSGAALRIPADRFYPTQRDERGSVLGSERAATALWVEIETAEAVGWPQHMLPDQAQRESQAIIEEALAEKYGRSVEEQVEVLRAKAAAKVKRELKEKARYAS